MADPAEIFRILNGGSGAGVAPDQAIDATTAAAALKGLVGFAFKDINGNVVLPQLDTLGRIAVTNVTGILKSSGAGELAAGSLTMVAVTAASITLNISKTYTNVSIGICARQDSLFQLIQLNDVTETVLQEFIVGAGQYSLIEQLFNLTFTTGATGVQKLLFKAKNFETLSSLRANLACLEVA